ncbi:MAG: 16S rRNA (cytosine(1402)-N(4))-methyltransferase RsmH [Candidatus Taylorbacteria bacterium]|nr:16S rRNA (cytosine(1402)-N(4))-methyltransferase RsmH [Candidatus Taylorbacteria bacterium]
MRHVPVLLQQVLEGLRISDLKSQSVYVDCNLGDGGHTEAVIEKTKGDITVIGFDLDSEAIERAKEHIQKRVGEEQKKDSSFKTPKLHFVNTNFRHFKKSLREIEEVTTKPIHPDAILFDLGISSYEIDESGRGFSFRKEEPLHMTFGTPASHAFTAYDIVNTWDEENIADIIYGYGEDTYARRIAKAIVEAREKVTKDGEVVGTKIKTTTELAEIVKKAYPSFKRHGRIHPATKTFQALRIAVNDELRSIEEAVPQAFESLAPGGRLAVISFHSLEDRIIKRYFKEKIDGGEAMVVTKKPIVPEDSEIEANPRSRSSKLRIIQKI